MSMSQSELCYIVNLDACISDKQLLELHTWLWLQVQSRGEVSKREEARGTSIFLHKGLLCIFSTVVPLQWHRERRELNLDCIWYMLGHLEKQRLEAPIDQCYLTGYWAITFNTTNLKIILSCRQHYRRLNSSKTSEHCQVHKQIVPKKMPVWWVNFSSRLGRICLLSWLCDNDSLVRARRCLKPSASNVIWHC